MYSLNVSESENEVLLRNVRLVKKLLEVESSSVCIHCRSLCVCMHVCVCVCARVRTHMHVCERERRGEGRERRSGLFRQTQEPTSVGPVGSYLVDPHILSIFGVKCSLLE